MTERIIFEFRALEGEQGTRFEFSHADETMADPGPFIFHCCPGSHFGCGFHVTAAGAGPGPFPGARSGVRGRRRRRREDMRGTLDFFMRMYRDLYGDEGEEGDDRSGAD